VGGSEAIDISPVDSPEHAHVDETVSEEGDEIFTQDEDEPKPSLDSESEDFDINKAATELEKRAVLIDSSPVTFHYVRGR
jgi:hypothetical protein